MPFTGWRAAVDSIDATLAALEHLDLTAAETRGACEVVGRLASGLVLGTETHRKRVADEVDALHALTGSVAARGQRRGRRRSGRQVKLRRAVAAERQRRGVPELVGILIDHDARLVIATHARGLARRDRRRAVPADVGLEAAVTEHIERVQAVTGRPVAIFQRQGATAS